MNKVFNSYFGGKNGSGTYHNIINKIRPHARYIEPFLGSGAVMLRKKQAAVNLGNDLDTAVFEKWQRKGFDWLQLCNWDAVKLLESLTFPPELKTVIYLDPPYPLFSRRSPRKQYRHEMTDQQHHQLLETVKALPCDVLVSTYENPIYQQALKGWNLHTFQSQTRKGLATEFLYMNYENSEALLHDYSYLGEDFTDRQRIKRKINREIEKLKKLNSFERNAIIEAITSQS